MAISSRKTCSVAAGVVTLIDLGLDLATDRAVGTPEYMAPEQIAGGCAHLCSDVYALGVVLYELFTLRVPFVGDRGALEYAHLSYRPPEPSRFAPVPASIARVMARCLAKDPAARFADAHQVRTAFAQALDPGAMTIDQAAPGGTPASTASASAAVPQTAALLFIHEAGLAVVDVQAALQRFGGQVAHVNAAADRCVVAFTHRVGDHPTRRALAAAEALLAGGVGRRVILDVATIAVRARPDGPARLSSPLFSDASRFPPGSAAPGLVITPLPARPSRRLRRRRPRFRPPRPFSGATTTPGPCWPRRSER